MLNIFFGLDSVTLKKHFKATELDDPFELDYFASENNSNSFLIIHENNSPTHPK